jgi:predicted dehydrogenase
MLQLRTCLVGLTVFASLMAESSAFAKDGKIRVGIVGCDTSHVIAFTKLINDPKATGPIADCEIVAAFPGGSPDLPTSKDRLDGFVKQLREQGIKIVDSLQELSDQTDAILIESVDGRPHLEQFRAVAHGKPVFIDKPTAVSLADIITIFKIADETHTPVFSSSSLRFCKEVQEVADSKTIGKMIGCETVGPLSLQPHHPDLFFYGIHGVEPLFTLMGTGCESVQRTDSPLSTVVVGQWKDGRIGSYRGLKKGHSYALTAVGEKGVLQKSGYSGYEELVNEICTFFKTHDAPFNREQTIEIYAFMEAADESKHNGGARVPLSSIIKRAEEQAAKSSSNSGGL